MSMSLKRFTEETGRKVFFRKELLCGAILMEKRSDVDDTVYFVKWEDGKRTWHLKKELIFCDELVGKKVRFVNREVTPERLWCSPLVDTIGVVCHVVTENGEIFVQWPMGTTCGDDAWFCMYTEVEIVEDSKEQKEEYTDKEVWEFLKPKMAQHANTDYLSQRVKDMVVAAYRSGYRRASKGRPFKIGDKK